MFKAKNLAFVAISLLVIIVMTSCNAVKDVESDVESDVEIAKADVEKYSTDIGQKVKGLEDEFVAEYDKGKEYLKDDVMESEAFVSHLNENVLAKSKTLMDEAKNLTVDNPKLKELHDKYLGYLQEGETALNKLGETVKNKSQEEYTKAKADVEAFFEKIKGYHKDIESLK